MMATFEYQSSWVHSHPIIPRALRQRATHNIDLAVEHEEGGKLAHGRLQSDLRVRASTRKQTITSDETPIFLCLSNPGRRQTAIFPLHKVFSLSAISEPKHSLITQRTQGLPLDD
jgi:hypothetical protein